MNEQTRGSEKVWVATTYYNDLLQHRVTASKEKEMFRKDILARAVLAYISKTEKKAYEEWLPAFVESQKQMVERQIAECYYDEHLKHREYADSYCLDKDICECCKTVYVTADEAAAYDEWYNTEKAFMDTLTKIPVSVLYHHKYLSHRKTTGNHETDMDIACVVINTYVTDEEKQAYQTWYADKAAYIATLHPVKTTLGSYVIDNLLNRSDYPSLNLEQGRCLIYLTDQQFALFEPYRYEHEMTVRTVPYSYYKGNLSDRYYEYDSYDSDSKTVDVKMTDKEWYEYTHKDEIIQESVQTLNLPVLDGSEKQVRWALEIRQKYINDLQEELQNCVDICSRGLTPQKALEKRGDKMDPEARAILTYAVNGTLESMLMEFVSDILQEKSAHQWIDYKQNGFRCARGFMKPDLAVRKFRQTLQNAEQNGISLSEQIANDEKARKEAKLASEKEFLSTHSLVSVGYKYYRDHFQYKRRIPKDAYDRNTGTIKVWLTESDIADYNKWLDHHDINRMQLVEMPYIEYKKTWSKYRYKEYNEVTGTVTVYLPKDVEYVRTVSKHYEDRHAFRKGYIKELDIVPDTIDPDSIDVVIPDELLAEKEA